MNVLIAVGGTGQHVALSYVDLEALAYLFVPLNRPRLYLLDADQVAGENEDSAWQKVIHSTELMTSLDGVRWSLEYIPPFDNKLDGPEFEKTVCTPLREWLFTQKQLRGTKFKYGYYGQAAVAATVFGHTFQTLQGVQNSSVRTLLSVLEPGEPKVFVTGSAVGGTGAGCLPRLVHCLAQHSNVRLMDCIFLPWFRLDGRDDGTKADAVSRNNEMNERFASGLLYFQDRLAKDAATLILGHPDIGKTTSARTWHGDTQQPMHTDLTLPYYAAIAASRHFAQANSLPNGLYAMVRPQLQGDNTADLLVMPKDGLLFGNDGKGATDFLGSLVAANLELCFEIAQVLTYLSWELNAPVTLFHMRFHIPELDHVGRTTAQRLRDLLALKMGALRRLHESDPSIIPDNQRARYTALDSFIKDNSKSVAIHEGLETLKRLTPAQQLWEGHVPLFEAWAKSISQRHSSWLPEPGGSPKRCLPSSLPANVVGFSARKVCEIEDITHDAVKDQFIVFPQVKPYAIPSTDALAFVLEHFYADPGKFTKLAIPGENSQGTVENSSAVTSDLTKLVTKGTVDIEMDSAEWAELALLLLRGVAAGVIRVEQVPVGGDYGPVHLTARYDEAVGHPDTNLSRQVAFFLDMSDVPVLLGVSDPRVLIVPSRIPCGTDGSITEWATVVSRLLGDPRLCQHGPADKVVKAWLLLLEDLSRTGFPGARLPGWLAYFRDHPWVRQAPAATYEFGLLACRDLQDQPLPRVLWPKSGSGTEDVFISIPLSLPVIGRSDDLRIRELINGFGFRINERLPVGNEPGANAAKPLVDYLNDPMHCPPFRYFYGKDLQASEMRAAVWEDRYPNEARLIRFGYFFVQGVPPIAYRVPPPASCNSLMVFPMARSIQCTSLTSLGSSPSDPKPILPDFPIQAPFADLIDRSVRPQFERTSAAAAIYTFKLKGYPEPLTWPIQINDTRVCTILLWPRFQAAAWQSYYMLSFFKDSATRLQVFLEDVKQPTGSVGWVKALEHHHFAQPLFDENLVERSFRGGRPLLFAFIPGHQATQETAEGMGIFQLRFEKAPDVVNEQWGVDFGTSNSVVAVHSPNHHATLTISTDGRLDQTYAFVQSSEPPLTDWNWFPTYTSNGVRQAGQESYVFPSQMISVSMKPGCESVLGNLQRMRYKADYTINSPVPDKQAAWRDRVVPYFKWISDGTNPTHKADLRALRTAYLLHLLEMCLSLRVGLENNVQQITRGLPRSVKVTFSLPLRMWDQCAEFQSDMIEICRLLYERSGVTFAAVFQWESLAGRVPQAAQANAIYAVADLGGGSLDLWGAYADGNSYPVNWAESLKLGGADLLTQIDDDCGGLKGQNSAAVLIRQSLLDVQNLIKGNDDASRSRDGFFDLACECVSRWVAAIAVQCFQKNLKAGPVNEKVPTSGKESKVVYPVHLMLLGMGWSINEAIDADLDGYVHDIIGERANDLLLRHTGEISLRVSVRPYGDKGMSWMERKAYLAKALAKFPGIADLMAQQQPKTLSLASLLDGPTESGTFDHNDNRYVLFKWHDELPYRVQTGLRFQTVSADQPMPELREHGFTQSDLASMINDLNTSLVGSPRYLKFSPFRLVIEPLSRHSKPNRSI